MRLRKRNDDNVEIQMAPLIDCMFLLLIFFLIATTLKEMEKILPVELPVADAAIEVPQEPDTLALGVDNVGRFYVNAQPATTKMLMDRLQKARLDNMIVRIDGDRKADYEKVVELVEMCRIEGIDNVRLQIRKDEAQGR